MKIVMTTLLLASTLVTGTALAKNVVSTYSLSEAMAPNGKNADALALLNKDVKFYFGTQQHPAAKKIIAIRTSNKTNAFNKSDNAACQWVFLSAMKSLRQQAIDAGGDAVINIRSNYQNKPFVSNTEYQCGNGFLMAGVALYGEVVKFK